MKVIHHVLLPQTFFGVTARHDPNGGATAIIETGTRPNRLGIFTPRAS